MDPIEVREERVVERGFPVQGDPAPVAAAPAAAVPVAAAPLATTPVAPAAATTVYTSRVGVYPVGYRTIQLVWLIVGVVDIILALDFIFRAANANNTGFAHYIYRLAGWLAAPFNGIFTSNTTANGTVVRWADVLAIAIYTIAAWIVTRLVRISATPRTGVNGA